MHCFLMFLSCRSKILVHTTHIYLTSMFLSCCLKLLLLLKHIHLTSIFSSSCLKLLLLMKHMNSTSMVMSCCFDWSCFIQALWIRQCCFKTFVTYGTHALHFEDLVILFWLFLFGTIFVQKTLTVREGNCSVKGWIEACQHMLWIWERENASLFDKNLSHCC